MADNNDLGSFLSGLIIGGLIGAAAALLMAPQSGEETRTVIREKGIELRDRAVETAEEARMRAEEMAQKMTERGKEIYEEQRGRVSKAIDAGKEAAQQKKSEISGETPSEM